MSVGHQVQPYQTGQSGRVLTKTWPPMGGMGLITSAREKDSITGTPTTNLQPIVYQGTSKPA